jgi:outer membrane protein OmpA-like peptidoglycan-associated protein
VNEVRTWLLAILGCAGCVANDPALDPNDPADVVESERTVEHLPDGTTVITDQANGRRVITETSIEILDNIEFIGDTIQLDPRSMRMIDAVAQTFIGNPSIKRVEVMVNVVPGALGVERARWLATQRATVVVDAIVSRGVDPARLSASGTIDRPRDETAFLILERGNE